MDERELIRGFRRNYAIPNPVARAAARDRLIAHISDHPIQTVAESSTSPDVAPAGQTPSSNRISSAPWHWLRSPTSWSWRTRSVSSRTDAQRLNVAPMSFAGCAISPPTSGAKLIVRSCAASPAGFKASQPSTARPVRTPSTSERMRAVVSNAPTSSTSRPSSSVVKPSGWETYRHRQGYKSPFGAAKPPCPPARPVSQPSLATAAF